MSALATIETAIEDLHVATAIYTTDPVVDRLLDRVGWPGAEGTMTILDPSAGDGAFVRRALARIELAPADFDSACRVRGYEIHAGAVAEARENVAQDLRARGWSVADAQRAAASIVIQRDFLIDPIVETFDAVCANPPYLRYARLPAYFRALYGKRLSKCALSDILLMFLHRLGAVLGESGGPCGLVTSDRWLFNETASKLREAIGMQFGLSYLARIDVDTAFYRPKKRVAGSLPRVHPVEILMEPAGVARQPITAAAISPDSAGSTRVEGPVLGDIADVRIAPWLGPAGIFVVDEQTARAMPGADLVPAIDTDGIDPKTDQLGVPKRYALRTRVGEEPTGAVREHLLATLDRMPARWRRGAWWLPPETITIPLDVPFLLVPRIARRLRVVDVPAGTLPLNHNLSVILKGSATLEEIRQVLLAPESQAWIETHAPRLEGGFYSITTKLLRRMPVPGVRMRTLLLNREQEE